MAVEYRGNSEKDWNALAVQTRKTEPNGLPSGNGLANGYGDYKSAPFPGIDLRYD